MHCYAIHYIGWFYITQTWRDKRDIAINLCNGYGAHPCAFVIIYMHIAYNSVYSKDVGACFYRTQPHTVQKVIQVSEI